MDLGPAELGLILLAVLLLFGYKKLPDASRSLGRSLRIFKGEMKGMKDDDGGTKDAAGTPVVGELVSPVGATTVAASSAASAAGAESAVDYEAAAATAEARAAELRARAEQARSASLDPVR